MTRIGLGGVFGAARDLSDDGSVAVGYDLIQLPGGSYAFSSFRWDASSGSVPLSQWLSEANVPYPADLDGILAFSVSGDGTAIGGYAYRDGQLAQPFIARVSPIGSGLISDIPAFSSSLAEAGSSARESASLLPYLALFGAHHRTLLDQGFSRSGSSCAWATADRASHRSSDLDYSVGEMGFCRFFGDAVAGFALGTHSQRQDLPLGGLSEASGEYLYAELSAPAGSSGLELSASAFLSRGEADIRRAYLNGAAADSSFGSTDVFSRALRLRADWRDALSAGSVSISPYASVAWLRSGSDPYSESGGGFPASFSGSDWRETDYRLGLASRIPLPQGAALRLDLSRAWREGDSGSVSGSAVGLPVLGFSLPSSSFGSQWTRASADLDLPAGESSLVSIGANAASDGSDPSWGLTASWRLSF